LLQKKGTPLTRRVSLSQGGNRANHAAFPRGEYARKGEKRMSDVAERVKKIVVDHLNVDEAKVTENASFIDDLGADSLDTVELVMAFEEEFGCAIPDEAAAKITSVNDAVGFINDLVGSQVSPLQG